MIRYDMKQGSPEWNQIRRGIPTASEFSRIITSEGAVSKQRKAYLLELVAERLGLMISDVSTAAMEWGREMEPEAARWYQFVTGEEIGPIGFALSDCKRYGASPDRLIGEDGLLEIKCPQAKAQIGYLLDPLKRGAYPDYMVQVQGQLFVTGRKWCDVVSYSRDLPPIKVRVERDEIFQHKLKVALNLFCDDLDHATNQIRETPGFVEAA